MDGEVRDIPVPSKLRLIPFEPQGGEMTEKTVYRGVVGFKGEKPNGKA